MNLPNKLTIARTIAVPFYVVFMIVTDIPFNYLWALIIFIAASVTDMIDGKIARKRGLVTNLGKFLDPLADKILVSSALICMVELGWTYSFLVIIIIAREFIVSALRLAAAGNKEHIVIAAGAMGKVKTAVTMVSICIITGLHIFTENIILLGEGFPAAPISDALMVLSTVLTIISGVGYVASYWKVLTEEK
ncbi:MAG: CDP-diacylglycerol--glycerol-3-phosphate 3-phosphatidyltransferase [Bacteroides sp.]|nr:CDP-diacylglycerol--glycerol-3-phosphate 3-phosphatidyltransferase [Bacteroides sp.]